MCTGEEPSETEKEKRAQRVRESQAGFDVQTPKGMTNKPQILEKHKDKQNTHADTETNAEQKGIVEEKKQKGSEWKGTQERQEHRHKRESS
jgi:hypothetical protein